MINYKNKGTYYLSLMLLVFSFSCNSDDDASGTSTLSSCNDDVYITSASGLFSDDFQAYDPFSTPSVNWVSVTEYGTRSFIIKSYQGEQFVEMSSYSSNEENKTWLISQKLDFTSIVDKSMSFELADALQNGNPLKLMYSTNYDGTSCPNNFTWNALGETQIEQLINNEENDDFNFEPTGEIDLSEINEEAVIAFLYEGSSNGTVTKIQIDNVVIGQSLAYVPVLTISGENESGQMLTANYSPTEDVEGNTITVAYQWYRADDALGSNELPISGETNGTYLLTNIDSGKYITVKATVGSVETTTDYAGPIIGVNTPPNAAVSIIGITISGETLTADTSTSSDLEGDALTFTYQWYSADDAAGTNEVAITGEIANTYTLSDTDSGKYISVKVIANDGILDSTEATSNYVGISFTRSLLISELADPDNDTRGRFVELYNSSNVDINLTGWKIIRYTNDDTTASLEEHILVGTIAANSTFVIGKISDPTTTTSDFVSIYGFAPDQAADQHSDGTLNKVVTPIDSNGDDQILLISPDGATMDIFGIIGQDGSGTAHEFEDGKAVRKLSVTQSNSVWDSSEWDVWNDTGDAGTTNAPQQAPTDFTPGIR